MDLESCSLKNRDFVCFFLNLRKKMCVKNVLNIQVSAEIKLSGSNITRLSIVLFRGTTTVIYLFQFTINSNLDWKPQRMNSSPPLLDATSLGSLSSCFHCHRDWVIDSSYRTVKASSFYTKIIDFKITYYAYLTTYTAQHFALPNIIGT